MIGIRIGDDFLDVPGDVQISLQLNNPILSEDNLSPGSISLPFDLPGEESSPKNAEILKHPDVLELVGGQRKFDAQLLVDDILYKRGKLVVRDSSPNKIITNFNFGLRTLSDEFKTKRVREIISETIVIDSAGHNKEVYIKPGALGAAPYKIQVNGRDYEESTLADLAAAITANTQEPRATATYFAAGSTPQGLAAPYIRIRPQFNALDPLTPLAVQYTENNGNSGSGFVWQAEGMSMTALHAAFDTFLDGYQTLPYTNDKIRFPVCFNDNLYNEAGFGFSSFKQTNYVNALNQFGTVKNNPNHGLGINVPFAMLSQNSLQPFLRLKYVLDKIAEFLGVQMEGDWLDADVDQMLIDNASPLDVPQEYLGGKKFIFFKRSFNLADLIEDVTVFEFLKRIQLRYNVAVYFNEATGRLVFKKREVIALANSDADITPMAGRPSANPDIRLTGIVLRAPKEEEDTLSVVDELTIGTDAEQTIEVKLGGIQQEFLTTINGAPGDVTGVLKSHPINTKFGMRIFFYKGLIDNGTFTYPACGKDALNFTNQFAGASGIYETQFKYWLQFYMNRRSVQLPVKFNLVDLLQLDWAKRYRFDRKLFLIKRIGVDITNTSLRISDVEIYTMF